MILDPLRSCKKRDRELIFPVSFSALPMTGQKRTGSACITVSLYYRSKVLMVPNLVVCVTLFSL